MRKVVFFFVLLLSAQTLFAQKTTIKGRVCNSATNSGLAYTTVSMVRASDSTLVTFTRADSLGVFTINSLEKGKYLLSASYVGYKPVWLQVEVSGSAVENIGNVYMQDLKSAGSVTVTANRPPVVINNDTLEFNTENFKTQPNAVVEDMLKKMPGITIEKDGTVKINGQTVKRVLVNGKEFFTGDVKTATRNLPADAVDKVQVFERQSDQAQFTGVEDGNSERTINLKLKKDRNQALFGKVTAGAGGDERYDGQANINKFRANEQLSFLGMSNNTNRQGFQIIDVMNFTGELSKGMRNGGGIVIRTEDNNDNNGLPVTGIGQSQQGVATTTAGGINYNNLWNKGNTDWSSNYMGSNIRLQTNKESTTQNILPGSTFNRFQQSNTINYNSQHKLNLIIDQKIDSSISVRITPSLTWQSTNSGSTSTYSLTTAKGTKLNDGFSNTTLNARAFDFSNNILLRKRFAKKGRTISLTTSMNYNGSNSNGTLASTNTFYNTNGSTTDSLLNQINKKEAVTKNFGSRLVYTEPLGKTSLLELSGYFNTNWGNSIKQTFDYNNLSGKHDAFNTALSNHFSSNYTYSGAGINFRANQKSLNITAGAQLQYADLKGVNYSHQKNIEQQFRDVLPNLIVQYNISRIKHIRFRYTTSTTQPGITQLQPVADVTDPLNVTIGNPHLKRAYQHIIEANLFAATPAKRKNLFAFASITASGSAIVRSDTIKQNGTRISSYTNANGVYNVFGNLNYGFPIPKSKSRLEVGTSITYSKNVSFINTKQNNTYAFSVGPHASYHYDTDNKIDLDITARWSVNKTRYSLQQFANNNYLQQNYEINITNYLSWGFVINNQFSYIINSGRGNGFNTNIPVWNASLAKGLMKNRRGEFKLSVFDLLNKNTGVTRSSNQGYIVDEKYNMLQRYFLLSFTYSLNKSGLSGGPRAVIKTF